MVSAHSDNLRHRNTDEVQNGTFHRAEEPLYDNAISPVLPPEGTSTLKRVLQYRQLHCADQLFATSDYEILSELHPALVLIKRIFNDPAYVHNSNDQSAVELTLSRITSAIRDTNCIETYAPGLVDVLEASLNHRMYVLVGANSQLVDSPHCKIASEILSTLFMYHSKSSVMTVAIPAAIKALNSANQELVRNTTSYLSLAAIHNGRILAQYSIQIIQIVLNGNYPLIRVMPQIYPENREPFHAHLAKLFRLLHYSATDASEKLSLLQLASMVTNAKPDLIIPHISEFDEFIMSPTTCTAVLHIYLSLISMSRVSSLVGQMLPLRRAIRHSLTQNNVPTMGKTISLIGRTNEDLATVALQDLVELCHKANDQNLGIILKEIEDLVDAFPACVTKQPSAYSAFVRMRNLLGEDDNNKRLSFVAAYNEIPQQPRNLQQSADSLQSKRSSRVFPNDPVHSDARQVFFSCLAPTTIFNVNEPSQCVGVNDGMATSVYKISSNASLGVRPNASRTSVNANNQKPATNETMTVSASPHSAFETVRKPQAPSGANIIWIPPPPEYSAPHHHIVSPRPPPSAATPNPPTNPPPMSYGIATTSVSLAPSALPVPTSMMATVTTPVLHTPLMIGRDGRVRPLSTAQRHTMACWMPSSGGLQHSESTTFPVHSEPTSSSTNANAGGSLAGSAVRMIDDHASRSRTHSTEGLGGRTSRANSDWTSTIDRGDVVRQFADNRRLKIRRFVQELGLKYPIPVKCTVEGATGAKKMRMRVHFACQVNDPHCIYQTAENLFAFKTKIAPTWLHLMFLQAQAKSIEITGKVLSQQSTEYKTLAHCYESLSKDAAKQRPFVTLVTSAFPAIKDQQLMLRELQDAHFFDSFTFNAQSQKWTCFSCTNPEKVRTLLLTDDTNLPLLEGQLKEKRGRWKLFRRWHTKYFTLSSAALSCSKDTDALDDRMIQPTIELRKIRSVKSLSRGRKDRKPLPRAFQIFTEDDHSYVLKANDRTKAEEWFQCLQIAVAQAQKQYQSHSSHTLPR
ncbi:PH domain containing protein [Aphelenchoides avenae]|nr:PH domain containing protein [Aphelenchus avenae]